MKEVEVKGHEEEVIEKTNEDDMGDGKDVIDGDAKEQKLYFFIIFNIPFH